MLSLYLSLLETDEERDQLSYIYQEYLDWMIQTAYHYVKNEEDAKDVVHEIFLDIIKTKSSVPINNKEETKAYLFICIRNRAHRSLNENNKIKTVNFEEYYSIPSNDNVEDEILKRDDSRRLLCYINALPKIYKDVLSLRFVNDISLKEISCMLRTSTKTIETRFRRGRTLLKEKFEDLDI